MNESPSVHEEVSRAYTRAVLSSPGEKRCCGSAIPKGVVAKSAGYGAEDLAVLPEDAVVNSFGCGNPLGFAGVREGEVVLDLGCGAGIDLLLAARKVGSQGKVIGVDMTQVMVEKARANVAKAGVTNVDVREGIIEHLPVDDASVDWVISNCVINLSPDKPAVFAEIARVLKPGGRMRVSDIVAEDLPEVVRKDPALYSSCVAGAISEEQYLQGLRDAGLVDVEVRERIMYSADQLEAFACSELPLEKAQPAEQTSCCGGAASWMPGIDVASLARGLEGRVWSARVAAKKP